MMISAYLEAGRVLDMPEVRAFALKSLDRVLAEAWDAKAGLAHVVAYGEQGGVAHGWLGFWMTMCFWGMRRWMRGS